MTNPKTDIIDNTRKDPDEWVSGDEPMTGAQASYLKTLTEQAKQPDMFEEGLTKAEASKRIDTLKNGIKVGTAQKKILMVETPRYLCDQGKSRNGPQD